MSVGLPLVDHFEKRHRPRDFVGGGDEEPIAAIEELDALRPDADGRNRNYRWRAGIADIDERYSVSALEAHRDERSAAMIGQIQAFRFRCPSIAPAVRIKADARCSIVQLSAGIPEERAGAGIEEAHRAAASHAARPGGVARVALIAVTKNRPVLSRTMPSGSRNAVSVCEGL